MSSIVSEWALLRLAEKATPTAEKRRSTDADVAGQPKYCLAMTARLGNFSWLLGAEGKVLGRDFVVRLLKSGVKPSIAGDLWSEGGMGLFGIFAHDITETYKMEKALMGLVACETKRHTAPNIKKWTDEAMEAIGLTPACAASRPLSVCHCVSVELVTTQLGRVPSTADWRLPSESTLWRHTTFIESAVSDILLTAQILSDKLLLTRSLTPKPCWGRYRPRERSFSAFGSPGTRDCE